MEKMHDSDCATHNMPAYPNGPCDCIASDAPAVKADEWVMVPREPTDEMIGAGASARYYGGATREVYRAMLSAAPPAPMPVVDEVLRVKAVDVLAGLITLVSYIPIKHPQQGEAIAELLTRARVVKAALTPPSIPPASEGTAAMSEEELKAILARCMGVRDVYDLPLPVPAILTAMRAVEYRTMSEVARITRERGEGE